MKASRRPGEEMIERFSAATFLAFDADGEHLALTCEDACRSIRAFEDEQPTFALELDHDQQGSEAYLVELADDSLRRHRRLMCRGHRCDGLREQLRLARSPLPEDRREPQIEL